MSSRLRIFVIRKLLISSHRFNNNARIEGWVAEELLAVYDNIIIITLGQLENSQWDAVDGPNFSTAPQVNDENTWSTVVYK